MNIKIKRKMIRKIHFPTVGLIIIIGLGVFGALFVFLSGIFNIQSTNMLYECICKNGMMIIFGVFFFLVFLYVWGLFFLNIIIPP